MISLLLMCATRIHHPSSLKGLLICNIFLYVFMCTNKQNLNLFKNRYGDCHVVNVTSISEDGRWVRFSPFFPHSNIPVPMSIDQTSESVEGIWQGTKNFLFHTHTHTIPLLMTFVLLSCLVLSGLKVFEYEGVDLEKMRITNMKNLKRKSNNVRGNRLGHSRGISPGIVMNYKISLKCCQPYLFVYLQMKVLLR